MYACVCSYVYLSIRLLFYTIVNRSQNSITVLFFSCLCNCPINLGFHYFFSLLYLLYVTTPSILYPGFKGTIKDLQSSILLVSRFVDRPAFSHNQTGHLCNHSWEEHGNTAVQMESALPVEYFKIVCFSFTKLL